MRRARLRPSLAPWTALAISAAGCAGEIDTETDWAAAAALFDPDRVLAVDVVMAPADWDALRAQTRTGQELFERPDCLGSPWPNPFTYFPATVTIDGDLLENVAVRKKGFIGSLSDSKPSLKISVDRDDMGRTHSGLEVITLNNSVQDASYVNQCIAYGVFERAGVPSPRCNFARVTVNGQPLGVYVHVESVEDEYVSHHFGSDDGNLYEGTLSDFTAEWSGTFEKKNNQLEADWSDLDAVVAAAQAPDAELLSSLAAVIDLEQFLVFWAAESVLQHWDGYAGNINNFWLYRDGGLLHFLPWGADQVLANANPVQGDGAPTSVYATGVLAWRLYRHPEGRAAYVNRLRAVLDAAWDEELLHSEIDRMAALLGEDGQSGGVPEALAARHAFVGARRAAVLAELDAGPPEWSYDLRAPFCQ